MRWIIQAFDWNNTATKRELRAAKNRSLVLRLKSPSTIQFSIDGHSEQSTFVKELITDVMVNADGVDVQRFRIGPSSDAVGETGHGVSFQGSDYRQVLMRRRLNASDTLFYPTGTDDGTIVWGLVTAAQSRTNGSYGITQGLGLPTHGDTSQATFQPGQWIGEQIDQLANKTGGFDWDVGTNMALNLYNPSRGSNKGVTIEYPKTISSFTRTKSASEFANDEMATGDQTTTPVVSVDAGIATAPEGRWDGVDSFPTVSDQATLTAKASYGLALRKQNLPNVTAILVPDFWKGRSHIDVGDTIGMRLRSGKRLNELLSMRVMEIGIVISDDAEYEAVQIVAAPA